MASIDSTITIENEKRLCNVQGEIGYFHRWEDFSKPIEASPFIGGVPAGVFSKVFGIVEFKDGVRRVDPTDVHFCDEQNELLWVMNHTKKKVR